MREILIDVNDFETRIALLDRAASTEQPQGDLAAAPAPRKELLEMHVERASSSSLVGNLYWGTVSRIVPSIQAAFVDIGLARPGFLHVRDMPKGRASADGDSASAAGERLDIAQLVREQQRLLVQVAKDPLNGKGVRLKTNITLAGRHVALLPRDSHIGVSQRIQDQIERERLAAVLESIRAELGQERRGCIARTAAQGVGAEQIRIDFDALLASWQRIETRCRNAPAAPTLIFEELPLHIRVVRDLAGPEVGAIVVNHAATCERLSGYVATYLPALRERVRRYAGAAPLFAAAGVENAIARALKRRVSLPAGGHLVIEHTEAMTTIDVNSGTRLDSANLQTTALHTNLQAAHAIPRELRVRNIGGIVVVDFIDMEDSAHQEQVMAALLAAAHDDPARFQATGFSPLGLVEISRRRVRETLLRQLCGPCSACAGKGYVKSPQTVCYDILRALRWRAQHGDATEQVVSAAQSVVDRLRNEEAAHLQALGRHAGQCIRLQVDARLPADEFVLESH